jgi:hypothetical protein
MASRYKSNELPKDNIYLRTALPFGKDSILLVSLLHGLFVLHHDTLSPASHTPELKNIATTKYFCCMFIICRPHCFLYQPGRLYHH